MGNSKKITGNVIMTSEVSNDLNRFEVSDETLALMAAGRLGEAAEDRDDLDVALICAARELERARGRLSELRKLVPYLAERRMALAERSPLSPRERDEQALLREMLPLLAAPTGGGS